MVSALFTPPRLFCPSWEGSREQGAAQHLKQHIAFMLAQVSTQPVPNSAMLLPFSLDQAVI